MEIVKREIVETRFIVSVEEAASLGHLVDMTKVPKLLTKALSNGHTPKVTIEHEPVPAARQLPGRSNVQYVNCAKCGNRIATQHLRRHRSGSVCKANRKKYQEMLTAR